MFFKRSEVWLNFHFQWCTHLECVFLCFFKKQSLWKDFPSKKIHLKMLFFSTHKHKLPQRSSSWPLATIPYPLGDPIIEGIWRCSASIVGVLKLSCRLLVFREDGGLKSWIFGQKRSCVLLFLVPVYHGKSSWNTPLFGRKMFGNFLPASSQQIEVFGWGGMVQPWKVIWLAGKSLNLFNRRYIDSFMVLLSRVIHQFSGVYFLLPLLEFYLSFLTNFMWEPPGF